MFHKLNILFPEKFFAKLNLSLGKKTKYKDILFEKSCKERLIRFFVQAKNQKREKVFFYI